MPKSEKSNSKEKEIQTHPQRNYVDHNQENEEIKILKAKIQETEEDEEEEMELIQLLDLRATCLQISNPNMTLQVGEVDLIHTTQK
jgi:hypothetical protein